MLAKLSTDQRDCKAMALHKRAIYFHFLLCGFSAQAFSFELATDVLPKIPFGVGEYDCTTTFEDGKTFAEREVFHIDDDILYQKNASSPNKSGLMVWCLPASKKWTDGGKTREYRITCTKDFFETETVTWSPQFYSRFRQTRRRLRDADGFTEETQNIERPGKITVSTKTCYRSSKPPSESVRARR